MTDSKAKPKLSPAQIGKKLRPLFVGLFLCLLLYFWARYQYFKLKFDIDSINTIYLKIPKNTSMLLDFSLSQPLINKINFLLPPPKLKRFQIIVHAGDSKQSFYLSRLIGLPSDEIIVREKYFYFKNSKTNEETRLGFQSEMGQIPKGIIPQGSYLLLNDNFKSLQLDSRTLGLLPRKNLKGHLIYAGNCPILPFKPRLLKE